MLGCPKRSHPIHKFKKNGKLYVADLLECQVLEIDELTWDILELCSFWNDEQIISHLKLSYSEADILDALDALKALEEEGLLFHRSASGASKPINRPKIFAPKMQTFGSDMTWTAIGAPLSHRQLLQAVSQYADVYITHEAERWDGAFVMDFQPGETASKLKALQMDFSGVMLWFPFETAYLSLLDYLPVPVVMPIREERGEAGAMMNLIFQWYAAMRDYDAFMVLTESTKAFYSQFLLDDSLFHIIENGVDTEHFKPMDKAVAKSEVAQMLNSPEMMHRKVVGFLSRFDPEKGAGIYIQLAERHPEYIFLVIVPSLGHYAHCELPSNVVYAGKQPQEKLPLFYNAFDVHCFPSLLAETFGRVVLEAMACGTPPIVPNIHSLPHVVGDAGVVVPAEAFTHELGSFAGCVSPQALSEGIQLLLSDDAQRQQKSLTARKRAMRFSWDASTRKLLNLFQQLNLKKHAVRRRRHFPISFGQVYAPTQQDSSYRAILLNLTEHQEMPLHKTAYVQSMEDGLALSLLKRHTLREVEAVLFHFCQDKAQVVNTIRRVCAFMNAMS